MAVSRPRRALLAVAAAALLSSTAAAQTIPLVDAAKLPRFEVVSTLAMAFMVRPYQLGPLPELIDREPFTIDARMPAGAPRTDLPLMVRALLIDRFKLRYHVDRRQQDGYVLSLARKDGRLGPGLRVSAFDCQARILALSQQQTAAPLPADAACPPRNGPGRITFGGLPLATLTQMLSVQLGAPVTDETGLSGNYDVELRFALASAGQPRTADTVPAPDDAPSIFTAVQEQLGLKLSSGKTSFDVLIIDHVERPEPD